MDWDLTGTPIENFHFSGNYGSDPANPSVTLLKGADWNVRSEDSAGNPGNIGTIAIDATVLSDSFGLTITVRGCHATTDDLDICICGTGSPRSPVILQSSCASLLTWSCVSGCP